MATFASRHLRKHASDGSNRTPAIWGGKIVGNSASVNAQAEKHFYDILNGPGGFVKNGKFLEKNCQMGVEFDSSKTLHLRVLLINNTGGTQMEFFEIVFNIHQECLDDLFFSEFELTKDSVKSSHFYDEEEEKDKEFHEILSFSKFFSINPGTGTIVVKERNLGIQLEGFQILCSCHEGIGTIDINFPEMCLIKGNDTDRKKCLKLLEYFLLLMDRLKIDSLKFGYEPATDDSTCLIELKRGKTEIKDLNQNVESFYRIFLDN